MPESSQEKHGFLINFMAEIIEFVKEIPRKFSGFGDGPASKIILIFILLAIFSLIIEFIMVCILAIIYLSKLFTISGIHNPLIIDSPNFSVITEGKRNFGAVIALGGLSFILAIMSIMKVFSGDTGKDEQEFVITFGFICILCCIIQLPVIIVYYLSFLKNNSHNQFTIKTINSNIYANLYNDSNFMAYLTVPSKNQISLYKNIETSLVYLFSDPKVIDNILKVPGNIRNIIYSVNMYINYHTMMGYNNENLQDALSTFTHIGKARSLVLALENISPINYFSLYTPYLLDYSITIGNMIKEIIVNVLKNAEKAPNANDASNIMDFNENQGLNPELVRNLIIKYNKIIHSEIEDAADINDAVNADLAVLDMDSITSSYENLLVASIVSQIPFPILMTIFVDEDRRETTFNSFKDRLSSGGEKAIQEESEQKSDNKTPQTIGEKLKEISGISEPEDKFEAKNETEDELQDKTKFESESNQQSRDIIPITKNSESSGTPLESIDLTKEALNYAKDNPGQAADLVEKFGPTALKLAKLHPLGNVIPDSVAKEALSKLVEHGKSKQAEIDANKSTMFLSEQERTQTVPPIDESKTS